MKDADKRRAKASKEHGFGNLKSTEDFLAELNHLKQAAGLKDEKDVDELGFSKSFYKFVGLGVPNDYLYAPPISIQKRIEDMIEKTTGMTKDTVQSFYTPMDNFQGAPSGGDTWYDFGRVPVSHLTTLSSKRIGALFTACNRPSTDVMDNSFEFVKIDDPEGDPVKGTKITAVQKWMIKRKIQFEKKIAEVMDFDSRTGLGHLFADKYLYEKQDPLVWRKKAKNTKPESLKTFSAFYMTPTNIYQPYQVDYDRNEWKFTGGLHAASNIHQSRMYVYEGIREPLGLRGLALGEICWVAWMCYLNVQYYILKSLAQLGLMTVGITVDREFPTTAETTQYLALLKTFQANNFYVLGRGAQLQVANAAGQISAGLNDFMEFLKEDISAACVFPKNQMFGRSEGGGLDGAGAIVSKEDYIASNLSVKMSKIKYPIMWILQDLCHFEGLDGIIPRFNIDLHKTAEQRYKEQLMKEQVSQTEMMTEQMELQQPLMKKQIELQTQMADLQMKMMKENPEQMLLASDKDEENLEEKESKPSGDFTTDFIKLKWSYDLLERQYRENDNLLKYMYHNSRVISDVLSRENEAYKRLFLKK